MIKEIYRRWQIRNGYKDVLTVAFPLILSTGALSVQHFVDRMFLAWYSPEAIAASMPAGILNFTILSLFIGTASYVSVFVSQYYGAGRHREIGKAVWQGLYFSLTASVFMVLCIFFADGIFSLVGHSWEVRQLEIRYFTILSMGGVFPVIAAALGGFFSGLGSTWVVMWVNVCATLVNVLLDYCLIFGNFGFPEMGMTGAAIATVISGIVAMVLYCIVIFRKRYRLPYGITTGSAFDKELFRRLIRFGFPSGLQFFIDMLGFTLFILLVGRYGKIELAATNIAFNINMLAFLPLVGFGVAVSVLVGQNLGSKQPAAAEFATWSAVHLSLLYMGTIAVCYLLFPLLFLQPFGLGGDVDSFQKIEDYGVVLLRFIAFYSLFDALTIIFSSAIKGAGDTKFVMKIIVVVSLLLLVIPTYLAVEVFHWHLYVAWSFATLYISVLGFIFLFRFRYGSWKKMLVIEQVAEPHPHTQANGGSVE